jgi:hypothetical protein
VKSPENILTRKTISGWCSIRRIGRKISFLKFEN